jgi:putative glutathione S-transferase
MGMLIDGKWKVQDVNPKTSDGEFHRKPTTFRHIIGNAPDNPFQPESGRYHLYVSLACPWAHRTIIFRKLKNLEDHISMSIVSPEMLEDGWTFEPYDGATKDHLLGKTYLRDIYRASDPKFTGRVTVPVLWDKKKNVIVNNESAEIIHMFNSQFNEVCEDKRDFYPPSLRHEMDAMNSYVYDNINNGVYRTGFARTQEAYAKNVTQLFAALDKVEDVLNRQAYLAGDGITSADWRLFTTLVRFDAVYYSHFKCNVRRIADYPVLSNYLRALYQVPGIAETVNMDHIKHHYYYSHHTINPTRIVPKGPELDFGSAHNRPEVVI